MFEVAFLAEAEFELSEAFDWYEQKQAGLGKLFYDEIAYYINLIETNPHLSPVKYAEGLRTASLNKFPFLIIFWIDEVSLTAFIVSIFHTSRSPKYL